MKKLTKWSIDQNHSQIAFKVKHLMIAYVKGDFSRFDASIYTTEKDFTTADVDVWIDATSIYTGDDKRDEHIKGPEFFDTEHHKQITFRSNTIGKQEDNSGQELWGDLTIKGITKKIKLKAEYGGLVHDPWGKEKAGFSITGKINRSDFDLKWNTALDSGGFVLGEEVIILCEIELVNVGEKDPSIGMESSASEKIKV